MKKLILGAAFVMAFATTALAQTDNKVQITSPAAQPATTTTTVATPVAQDPAAMSGTATTTAAPAATVATPATAVAQQPQPATDGKEYNKVTQNQIAPAVLKKAVAKYKDYALVEALAAADGSEYKLVLTKDGKDVAAYYKPNGDFIKEETV